MMYPGQRVLCISWNPDLAKVRRELFEAANWVVTSAIGPEAAELAESFDADLLVVGWSVPREEKRRFMRLFRRHSEAPILSLLAPGQRPLPEATIGIPGEDYSQLKHVIEQISR